MSNSRAKGWYNERGQGGAGRCRGACDPSAICGVAGPLREADGMVLTGTVEQGKHLGRQLGFPTANIRPDDGHAPLPENGVYAAVIRIEGEEARACMLNQGVHPTAPEGKPTIEAHLLDFDGNLYGKRAEVEYLRFLRPERRFDGLEALKAQLFRDLQATREWFEIHPETLR